MRRARRGLAAAVCRSTCAATSVRVRRACICAPPRSLGLAAVRTTSTLLRRHSGSPVGVKTHPRIASHVSVVQVSPSSQTSGTPAWQAPLDGSHVSAPLHASPSSQATAVPPHSPPRQVSFVVQRLPSSHGLVLLTETQPTSGTQESSVHGFPSSHASGGPASHAPAAG